MSDLTNAMPTAVAAAALSMTAEVLHQEQVKRNSSCVLDPAGATKPKMSKRRARRLAARSHNEAQA